jgi:histone-lysine N-methyltransferase SETD1
MVPSNELSATDKREDALKIAMREAKKRGLPDGWEVFYGNSNRKKWKAPGPGKKVFDSVPKALEYVEKMNIFHSTPDAQKEKYFNHAPFTLDREPEWVRRHLYHDEATSLMGDAEVLLRILEKRIGIELAVLFDIERVHSHKSPSRLKGISRWELYRAGRFVRFVKRLRILSQIAKPKERDVEETRKVQLVVCKMASAFVHCVCVMFQIDMREIIKCSDKLSSLLVSPACAGTVDFEQISCSDDDSSMLGGKSLEDIAYLQLKAAEELNAPIHELVVQANDVSTCAASKLDTNDTRAECTVKPISTTSTNITSSLKSEVVCDQGFNKTENNRVSMSKNINLDNDCDIFATKSDKELDIAEALMMLNGSPSRVKSKSEKEHQIQGETSNNKNISVNDRIDIGINDEKKIESETIYHTTETNFMSLNENVASTNYQDRILGNPEYASADTSVIEDTQTEILKLRNDTNSTEGAKVDSLQTVATLDHAPSDQNTSKNTILPTEPSETVHHQESSRITMTTPKPKVKLPWMSKSFLIPEPMKGWHFSSGEYSHRQWIDSRTCCLCAISGDSDICIDTQKCTEVNHLGRLLPLPGGEWIHSGCAVWSSEVWEDPVGGKLNGVLKAKSRGAKLRCFGCGQYGATIGCHRSNCPTNYHFHCAKVCRVVFTESHKVYCEKHKDCAKDKIIDTFDEHMKILRVVDEKVELEADLCYRSGALVVHSLGEIQVDCDGYHSNEYIMPPGFCSSRIFWSYVKPKTRTLYLMQILRSEDNKPLFQLRAADSPSENFHSFDISKLYKEVMTKVWEMNKGFFSHNDLFSVHPIVRSKKNKKGFCLNGPQFFGYGVDFVREALEKQEDAIACAAPLSKDSVTYKFCFHKPTEQEAMDLQRHRAVVKAEKALENASGCARTEGSGAFDKSKGSGRITRALVSKSSEGQKKQYQGALTKGGADSVLTKGTTSGLESERELASTQAMYDEMKSVPMEERLEAKRSHIHGWGLFAKKDYSKNSMIAEYMGETIGQPIADKREKMYEISGEGSCYMFRLDLHEIVDATKVGCMARFMNHCCAANAYAKIITVTTDQGTEKKIVVFANQDIPSGGEITYDYKFPVEDGSLRCTCGAPNCIGRMN